MRDVRGRVCCVSTVAGAFAASCLAGDQMQPALQARMHSRTVSRMLRCLAMDSRSDPELPVCCRCARRTSPQTHPKPDAEGKALDQPYHLFFCPQGELLDTCHIVTG